MNVKKNKETTDTIVKEHIKKRGIIIIQHKNWTFQTSLLLACQPNDTSTKIFFLFIHSFSHSSSSSSSASFLLRFVPLSPFFLQQKQQQEILFLKLCQLFQLTADFNT